MHIVNNTNKDILYVHSDIPMLYRFIIPISIPALVNRIPYKVEGLYESELKYFNLNKIRIIIIDLHWYLSLKSAMTLVKSIKRINPAITIIAEGITASLFAEILVNRSDIDFVIRGDAEIPLPLLIKSILDNGRNLEVVPNLIGRNGFKTEWKYVLTREDMDDNDYYRIDFFPSFKKDIHKVHSM